MTDFHRQTNSTRSGVCLSLFLGIWILVCLGYYVLNRRFLKLGIKVHRPDDEAVLGQIRIAAFLMWQLKIQFFTMKSLILAQDER